MKSIVTSNSVFHCPALQRWLCDVDLGSLCAVWSHSVYVHVCVCVFSCLFLYVCVSRCVLFTLCVHLCFTALNLLACVRVYVCVYVCACVFASMGPRSKRRCCHRLSAASWFPSIDSQPINSLNDAIIRPPSPPPHLKLRGLFWINPDHFVCKLHNCIAFRFLRQPNWSEPWVWMPNERPCPSKRLCRTQAETIRETAAKKKRNKKTQLFLFLYRPQLLQLHTILDSQPSSIHQNPLV